jgi:hypothetical protein
MNNSDYFNSQTAIEFANELLKFGIESDEILILSTLNWKNDTSEIRIYLNFILAQLGINEFKKEFNIDLIATTLVEKLNRLIEIDTCLSRLKEFSQLKDVNNLNDFLLLYWARVSWKQNDENKMCYLEDYRPENEITIMQNICSEWLSKNSIEKEVKEYFKCDPNILHNKTESIDLNFFNRLKIYEVTFKNESEIDAKAKPIYKCIESINGLVQDKWLNRIIIKQAIEILNNTVRSQSDYFTTSWKDFILHLRHLAYIYELECRLNENFELIENKNAYA